LVPTDEHLGADQIKILRACRARKNFVRLSAPFWTARNIKTASIRAQNPDWPEDRIEAEATRMFSNARS
jgi:hypothetical protein